jgi:hypothetical protein
MHQRPAQRLSPTSLGSSQQRPAHNLRYLRAVADRLWFGPEFATNLPDRAALERVAIVNQIGNTLMVVRRPECTLRDLELCLEPTLASQAESRAFRERFMPARSSRR